jgi:hypothetical protein
MIDVDAWELPAHGKEGRQVRGRADIEREILPSAPEARTSESGRRRRSRRRRGPDANDRQGERYGLRARTTPKLGGRICRLCGSSSFTGKTPGAELTGKPAVLLFRIGSSIQHLFSPRTPLLLRVCRLAGRPVAPPFVDGRAPNCPSSLGHGR